MAMQIGPLLARALARGGMLAICALASAPLVLADKAGDGSTSAANAGMQAVTADMTRIAQAFLATVAGEVAVGTAYRASRRKRVSTKPSIHLKGETPVL